MSENQSPFKAFLQQHVNIKMHDGTEQKEHLTQYAVMLQTSDAKDFLEGPALDRESMMTEKAQHMLIQMHRLEILRRVSGWPLDNPHTMDLEENFYPQLLIIVSCWNTVDAMVRFTCSDIPALNNNVAGAANINQLDNYESYQRSVNHHIAKRAEQALAEKPLASVSNLETTHHDLDTGEEVFTDIEADSDLDETQVNQVLAEAEADSDEEESTALDLDETLRLT